MRRTVTVRQSCDVVEEEHDRRRRQQDTGLVSGAARSTPRQEGKEGGE